MNHSSRRRHSSASRRSVLLASLRPLGPRGPVDHGHRSTHYPLYWTRSRAVQYESTNGATMAVAKVTEITSSSKKSFDDALTEGIRRATKTLKNVSGAWMQDQEVVVKNNKIVEYRVRLKVTFVLND
jgi:dodecin